MTPTKPPTPQGISALLQEALDGYESWLNDFGSDDPLLRRDIAVKRQILALCESETDETGGKPLALRIMRLLAGIYEAAPAPGEGERE